ncbi:hypothetical protein LTR62_007496 [Meristemomyces frigidus]|uniref:TLC domain-containing protein n=1 Tax=Meristemomyces frigidus TaxID=1508187 RepID=A0AAN7TBV4_9PEZI|nr:hypothetical protein LTR62_007496 [Meristemomyces frigidus]
MDLSPPEKQLQPSLNCDPHTPPPQKMTQIEDMTVCGNGSAKRRKRAPRSDRPVVPDSLWEMLRKGIVQHQLGLSINIMLLVGLLYLSFPSLREKMSAFFGLSYSKTGATTGAGVAGMYGQGLNDLYLVGTFIVLFTGLRAGSLDYILLPLAGWCGIAKKKDRIRFGEQSYMMLYYIIYWTWGMVLFVRNTPSSVNGLESLLISLWTGFPQLAIGPGMKLYYLSQFAFWIQQVAVIHLEEPRKDHWQMLSHHVITIALLAGSYPYRQWRVGNAILVCMDLVDFIFPAAKILKYLQWQTACDVAFVAFVLSWLGSRHIAYNAICWSIWAHVDGVTMAYGTYDVRTGNMVSTDGGKNLLDNLLQPILHPHAATVGFNSRIRWTFLGLLLALQGITIGWFVMIVRVVIRVLRGEGADDSRSEAEDNDEDLDVMDEEADDEEVGLADVPPEQPSSPSLDIKTLAQSHAEKEAPRYIEIEASTNDAVPITFSTSTTQKKVRKSKGISSGLNLGEHKEILNRIGCLSDEQLAREREMRADSPAVSGARQR